MYHTPKRANTYRGKEHNNISTRKCGYVDKFLWIEKASVDTVDNMAFYPHVILEAKPLWGGRSQNYQ